MRRLQFTALSGCAQYPVNCLDEMATLLLLPCIGLRESPQICVKFLPLMAGKSFCRHSTTVGKLTERN